MTDNRRRINPIGTDRPIGTSNRRRIRRSQLLTHPLNGRAGLLREIGSFHDHGAVFDAWAQGLARRPIVMYYPEYDTPDPHINAFTSFIYDETIHGAVASIEEYVHAGRNKTTIIYLVGDYNRHMFQPSRKESIPGSAVTSMSVSPSRMMLTTTSGGFLYPLHLDDISRGGWVSSSPIFPNPRGVHTYWASAANPRHDICSFAVVASNGTIVLRESEDQWNLQQIQTTAGPDQMTAIDWLGPNVVLTGCKAGAVRLYDMRSHAGTPEPRVQHTPDITSVRSINDNFIVVAGRQHQLCTYDLRYANRDVSGHTTRYYDRFPTYRNWWLTRHSIGLDVHQNLVAAANDEGTVQIFDVKKGVELNCAIDNLGANAPCVRFVDEEWSGNGLKLMVAAGRRIDQWTFGDPGY